jgi:hypothetical protein
MNVDTFLYKFNQSLNFLTRWETRIAFLYKTSTRELTDQKEAIEGTAWPRLAAVGP